MKYLISPKLRYRTFKKLWDSVPVDMECKELCRCIWKLNRDKKLLVVYENGDFHFPKEIKGKYMVVENGGKKVL